ncbi:GNAT family N-acetyltransferase [Paenibacillus sp. CGMCC 1.16610]|uniref:GNAT family N-acetyltransferase n=1 Tax=Paenibacillus anseongense TaxID=2682845 RepID=A0ABW9UED5_9BACL|nr:GNAT family N-acetyltransferase [Paenibacillus sp. CGMCC 1.16610]MVQ37634.1 GNAT family N-acetyltransferase [Paenibacillus anseongense]
MKTTKRLNGCEKEAADSNHRGKNIGQLLLQHVEEYYRSKNCHWIVLLSNL